MSALRRWCVLGALVLGACAGEPAPTPEKDVAAPEDTADVTVDPGDVQVAKCPGGEGCACKTAADCDSGACIDTLDGRVCAATCGDGCAAGYTCVSLTGADDDAFVCVPQWGLVCQPCRGDGDCAAPGIKDPACVLHSLEVGSFCSVACEADADCPSGHQCQLLARISAEKAGLSSGASAGVTAKFCAPKAVSDGAVGACGCGAAAVAHAASTACWVPVKDDDKGASAVPVQRCLGERVCGDAGLGECARITGPAAKCVGSACDGKKDGDSCDDGKACTTGETCKGGQCVPADNKCPCDLLENPCKDDDDLCNGVPWCDTSATPAQCKANPATVVSCSSDGDTACASVSCVPKTGKCTLLPRANGLLCEDGDVCTSGDGCDGQGQCASGQSTCACATDADCAKTAAAAGADPCLGQYYCDKEKPGAHVCKINVATIVQCAPSAKACQQHKCDKKTGKCAFSQLDDDTPCDDGDSCTTTDVCAAGTCQPGPSKCACKTDKDCADKDDGDPCNGTLYCNPATNQCALNPATIVHCPNAGGGDCLKNQCLPTTGKCTVKAMPDGTSCDDGDSCTAKTTCTKGGCGGGDNNCACEKHADCAGKEDGDLCNGTLFCDLGALDPATSKLSPRCRVNPATLKACSDAFSPACQRNVCQPETGTCKLVPLPKGATCTDGSACTEGDGCDGKGGCATTGNICACKTNADCTGKVGDNPCTGAAFCNQVSHSCELNAAVAKVCDSAKDTDCLRNTCDPGTGKCATLPAPSSTPCQDGNHCTALDHCENGQCAGGTDACPCKADADCAGQDDGNQCNGKWACFSGYCAPAVGSEVSCKDDGNPCTVTQCAPLNGKCETTAKDDGAACTPTNPCVATAVCAAKICKATKAKSCDDGNGCTWDACDEESGCKHGLKTGDCDDGDSCTVGDTCEGAVCKSGKPKDCEDNNPCTQDECGVGQDCVHLAAAGTCTDNNACTVGDVCKDKACAAGAALQCDDGNVCTDDSCDKALGCQKSPNTGPCSDNDVCTDGDGCKGGACVPGGLAPCNDGNVCTDDSCDNAVGCVRLANAVTCSDGSACTDKDACKAKVCVSGSPTDCDDLNSCTIDSCSYKTGCAHVVKTGACDDGNACTTTDTCDKDKCIPGPKKDCDDHDLCTTDSCDTKLGCQYVHHKNEKVVCYEGTPGTAGTGACVTGIVTCDANGKNKGCVGQVMDDGIDICGGADSDCDGVTDEDCLVGDGTGCPEQGCRKLAGTSQHMCWVRDGGAVWCWGYNGKGQLATGDVQLRDAPAPAKLLPKAWQVTVGGNTTCVIDRAGQVHCVGNGSSGQLGDGLGKDSTSPVKVQGMRDAAYLSMHANHVCAVRTSGQVSCWGANSYRQTGTVGATKQLKKVDVPGLADAVIVAAGQAHNCALTKAGEVKCWGRGQNWELGQGKSTGNAGTPLLVKGLPGKARWVTTKYLVSCAALQDQSVWCWGRDYSGALTGKTNSFAPTKLAKLGPALVVTEHLYSRCVLDGAGKASCQGENERGELGDGGYLDAVGLRPIAWNEAIIAIVGEERSRCGLSKKGEVRCWGHNNQGVRGGGVSGDKITTPAQVLGVAGLQQLAPGRYATCARRADGQLSCWGRNDSRHLEPNANLSAYLPPVMAGVASEPTMALGERHLCVGHASGVRCRGRNTWGQLGNGATKDTLALVDVKGVGKVLSLCAGWGHTCAVDSTGKTLCWGNNANRQLGTGGTASTTTPQAVKNVGAASQVSCPWATGCAVSGGKVFCWGDNYAGQVGNGTKGNYVASPIAVSGVTTAKQVAVGQSHACAVLQDGSARCWGRNSYGLGNGSAAESLKPVTVKIGVKLQHIAVGWLNTCALDEAGKVWCWGKNTYGQAGNGTASDVTLPTALASLPKAVEVAMGNDHACAILADSKARCWGRDTYNQTGSGLSLTSTPQPVKLPSLP